MKSPVFQLLQRKRKKFFQSVELLGDCSLQTGFKAHFVVSPATLKQLSKLYIKWFASVKPVGLLGCVYATYRRDVYDGLLCANRVLSWTAHLSTSSALCLHWLQDLIPTHLSTVSMATVVTIATAVSHNHTAPVVYVLIECRASVCTQSVGPLASRWLAHSD